MDTGQHPDMLAVNSDWRAVVEVSCSPNKDFGKARSYAFADLSPALKTRLGNRERKSAGSTFFVTEETGIRSFPPMMNAVQVFPPFEKHLPAVYDPDLKKALDDWPGYPGPVSSYNLLALPESDVEEIKLQVAGMIKLAAVNGDSILSASLANRLLGELAPAFSNTGKAQLVRAVASALESASFRVSGLVWSQADRSLSVKKVDSSSARKAFSKEIQTWLNIRFLESFSTELEEEELEGEEDGDE